MCTTCGCGHDALPRITNLQTGESTPLTDDADHAHHQHATAAHSHHGHFHAHAHDHDGHSHSHDHGHPHSHGHDHSHSHAHDHFHPHDHGPSVHRADAERHPRTVSLERELLEKNAQLAARNRGWLAGRGILALNLVSSPGAGKTTLLERTLRALSPELALSVIEGDQETSRDAERIAATGCRVVQINTGTGCHLEASMVARGLEELDPPLHSVVLIENVGNLVCPALFDLGEHAKVVVMSVTEGADKPLKYPHMFRASDLMIVNKIDLLPYVDFDIAACIEAARRVNPNIEIVQLSATRGDGLEQFHDWVRERRRTSAPQTVRVS